MCRPALSRYPDYGRTGIATGILAKKPQPGYRGHRPGPCFQWNARTLLFLPCQTLPFRFPVRRKKPTVRVFFAQTVGSSGSYSMWFLHFRQSYDHLGTSILYGVSVCQWLMSTNFVWIQFSAFYLRNFAFFFSFLLFYKTQPSKKLAIKAGFFSVNPDKNAWGRTGTVHPPVFLP